MKTHENKLICQLKVFWSVLSSNEQFLLMSVGAVFILVAVIFLYGINEIQLNFLILNSIETFFTYFSVLSIYFIYRLLRKKIIKNKLFYLVWGIFFLLSISYIPVLFNYESTQIGNLYEANEYKEKYYVIMSREPEQNLNRKVYTLPAEIERRKDYLYTTEIKEDYYGQSYGGNEVYMFNYHINYLYFPNGGYLYFDYDKAYEEPELTLLKVGKETKVEDYKENQYYITLTKNKIK